MNSGSIDNKTTSVNIVEARYLSSNEVSFEVLDGAIKNIFGPKYPFRSHNVGVGKLRNQNLATIVSKLEPHHP